MKATISANGSLNVISKEISEEKKKNKYETLKLFERYLFNQKTEAKEPEVFIRVDNGRVSTIGNLLVISGPVKSGKTSLVSALIAGSLTLSKSNEIDTLGLEITPNFEGSEIVYFNTELGDYDFWSLIQKILKRAKLKVMPEFFHALNLTGLSPSEHNKVFTEFIKELQKINRIRVIVLDGIAEFVHNVNDPEACQNLVQQLLGTARLLNCVIVAVIHKNPGKSETKIRGHLGSDLSRKGEATLELSKKGGAFLITGKDMRNSDPDFNPIKIKYCEEVEDFIFDGTLRTERIEVELQKTLNVESKLKAIFKENSKIKYGELTLCVSQEFKIGDRMAKNRIKEWVELGLICKQDGEYVLVSSVK